MSKVNYSPVIHTNYAMAHQVVNAKNLQKGFEVHGISAPITSSPDAGQHAAFHVVQGPHFALRACMAAGYKILLIDRCFWGDHREYLTLAWLEPTGRRIHPDFAPGDRDKPALQPYKRPGTKLLYLADWGQDVAEDVATLNNHYKVNIRQHPANKAQSKTLHEQLKGHSLVAGRRTSAMVDAAIMGYAPIVLDNDSPAAEVGSKPGEVVLHDRQQWLNNLSYMNWRQDEIAAGEAIGALLCQELYKQHPFPQFCR